MKTEFDVRLRNNLFPSTPSSFRKGLEDALEKEGVQPRRVKPWAVVSIAVTAAACAAALVLVLTGAFRTGKVQPALPNDTAQATVSQGLQPTPRAWAGSTNVFQLAPDYALDHLEMPQQELIAASILDFLMARGKDEPDELWILGVRPFTVEPLGSYDEMYTYALVLAQSEFGDDGYGGERGPELYCLSLPDGLVRWSTDNSPIGPCQTHIEIEGQTWHFFYGANPPIDEPGEPWVNRGAIKGAEPGTDIEFSMFQSYGKMHTQLSESRHLGALREYFVVRVSEHDYQTVSDSCLEFDTLEAPYTVNIADIPCVSVVTADFPAQKPYVSPTMREDVAVRNLTQLNNEKAMHYADAILDALHVTGVDPKELWLCAAAAPALDPDPEVQKAEWRDSSIETVYLVAQYEFEGECGPELFYYQDNRVLWMTPDYDPFNLNVVHDTDRNQTIVFGRSCAYDGRPLAMEYGQILTDSVDYSEHVFSAALPLAQVQARTEGSHGEPSETYLWTAKGDHTVLSFFIEASGSRWMPYGPTVELSILKIPEMAVRTAQGLLSGSVAHLMYATDYTEYGVLAADGVSIAQTFEDLASPANDPTAVPHFSLNADWEIVPACDAVTVKGIRIFNTQFEELSAYRTVEQLKDLPSGEYYLCFECLWTGSPIPGESINRNRMELAIYKVTK